MHITNTHRRLPICILLSPETSNRAKKTLDCDIAKFMGQDKDEDNLHTPMREARVTDTRKLAEVFPPSAQNPSSLQVPKQPPRETFLASRAYTLPTAGKEDAPNPNVGAENGRNDIRTRAALSFEQRAHGRGLDPKFPFPEICCPASGCLELLPFSIRIPRRTVNRQPYVGSAHPSKGAFSANKTKNSSPCLTFRTTNRTLQPRPQSTGRGGPGKQQSPVSA